MIELIKDPYLSKIKDFLQEKLGLYYSDIRASELSRKIGDAAKKTGYPTTLSYIIALLEKPLSRRDLEILASCVTIGETYFLREKAAFEFLREEYLKNYIYKNRTGKRKLSIWSAGCSSGEEVYSIAGMIRKMLPDLDQWEIKIVGTDINPRVLEKARIGIYSKWSFRKTPDWFMKHVEEVDNNRYQICECLKEMVEFKSHNLAGDPAILQGMDIIFCRNVLIYFSKELISKVTSGFYEALKDEGVLILSPVEVSLNISERFVRKTFDGHTFFIKSRKSKESLLPPKIEEKTEILDSSMKDENSATEKERFNFLYQEGLNLRIEHLLLSKYKEIEEIPEEYQELLVKTYMKQNKIAEAEEACQKVIIADQCRPAVCYYLAVINLDRKQYSLAEDILEKILYHAPDFVLAVYQMGILAGFRKEIARSKKYFDRAEELLKLHDKGDIIDDLNSLTAEDILEKIKIKRRDR